MDATSISVDSSEIDTKSTNILLRENSWHPSTTFEPVKLAWRDLTVSICHSRGAQESKILSGLSGYADPGRLLAIMGPSGSGKSTLLDALADRLAKNIVQTGDIWMNGHKKKPSLGTAAYVMQDDTLIGTLNVRETILYSAWLRLPDSMSNSKKCAIAEEIILEMGLQHCADQPIGNWHLRGLSGGEKRRVSIALELLARPQLIYLDEPTSGLDSASAFFVMYKLKKLARRGHTIIAAVHQPSSEVFELFDNLLLLAKGKTVYFGEARGANECFTTAGFPCPPLRNPSDHFLRAINSDFDRIKSTFKEFSDKQLDSFELLQDPFSKTQTSTVIAILQDAYQNSEAALDAKRTVQQIIEQKGIIWESRNTRAGFWTQWRVLTCRSFLNMLRDMGYYWLRIVVYFVVSLCIGSLFFKAGTAYESIQARASCMFFAGTFLTFMSIGGFPSFTEDMKVFHRERLNGHYGTLTFILANALSSLPFLFLIAVMSGSIIYYMVGLHPGLDHFLYFVLFLYASLMVVEALMKAIASVIPNFLMGIVLGAGIQGVYILVSGFFRSSIHLPKPVWRYPMSYISFHSYTLQGMYQNDFLGVVFQNQNPNLPKLEGELILRDLYGVDLKRSKLMDLGVLFGMSVGYSFIFFLMIKVKENAYLQTLHAKLTCKST